ncbi:NAD(P)-dependent oxidoreductase [Gephyromycinifex aptenodytis]|uniref:NAD(P)-dependent oxidoreductase n=1 Tax=Gephyromycinifex aptenodytis TaxID=2716227 RepID=UPI001447025F|nr:NAD(P)-dependent oxidoreductase [Gephyromycinifex aptenodytis]
MNTTIAVLGLGAMGLPMAEHLSNTFDVRGYDPSPERRALFSPCAANPREAATGADIVLFAVRNAAQLEDALWGPQGVAEVLTAGSAVLLTSTVGIAAVTDVAARLTSAGIGLIDAPVSGGPARAGSGDLLVTVGAHDDVYERALPVLEAMSATLVRVGGEPGAGQAMKTVNQLLCGVHIAAAAEALALARALGLDTEQALRALGAGAAQSFMLDDRGPRVLQAYDEPGAPVKSRLDIFVKDMGIVDDAARTAGLATPVAAAAHQLYLLGQAAGLGACDDSSVIRVLAPHPTSTEMTP